MHMARVSIFVVLPKMKKKKEKCSYACLTIYFAVVCRVCRRLGSKDRGVSQSAIILFVRNIIAYSIVSFLFFSSNDMVDQDIMYRN